MKSVGNLIAGFFGGDGVRAESTSAETADSEEDALDAEREHQSIPTTPLPSPIYSV